MPASFLDTNVLLYLVGLNPAKAERAEALVAEGGVISVQVLDEMANVGCRKMLLSWSEVHALLDTLRDLLDVRPMTVAVHEVGLGLAEKYKLSIYDAMIVASALEAECDALWSEDMHNGLLVDGRLRIVNPFEGSVPNRHSPS
ncbi:MAG: PIN domain-containing protein [Caulobacteraceae bacterium]|nr:PIN domain-containing protein [Caulobacteraceae bacterium]